MSVGKLVECDARLVVGEGYCSDDQFTVYSGSTIPAKACGFHATYFGRKVFEGRKIRMDREGVR